MFSNDWLPRPSGPQFFTVSPQLQGNASNHRRFLCFDMSVGWGSTENSADVVQCMEIFRLISTCWIWGLLKFQIYMPCRTVNMTILMISCSRSVTVVGRRYNSPCFVCLILFVNGCNRCDRAEDEMKFMLFQVRLESVTPQVFTAIFISWSVKSYCSLVDSVAD